MQYEEILEDPNGTSLTILYINSLSPWVIGRSACIFYGRTGPDSRTDGQTDFLWQNCSDRRPLYNLDQRSLISLSMSGQSVCDGDFGGWGRERPVK